MAQGTPIFRQKRYEKSTCLLGISIHFRLSLFFVFHKKKLHLKIGFKMAILKRGYMKKAKLVNSNKL